MGLGTSTSGVLFGTADVGSVQDHSQRQHRGDEKIPDRRCCCGGCEIGSDNFDRADNEDLGPKWPNEIEGNTAQTGDWDIHDNTAEIQDSSGGIAVFGTKHPVPNESMVVWANAPDIQEGDIYEIIINWKNMSNYHFAQIEATSEDPPGVMWITARLGVCSGGVRSTVYEVQVGRSFADSITSLHHIVLNALIGDEGFCLLMSGTGPDVGKIWDTEGPISGGYWAGIAAYGRDYMQMDDFVFWKHFEDLADCPYCVCKCGTITVPKVLTATIVDCTGRMTEAEGCEIELEWQQEDVGGLPDPPFSGWLGLSESCCAGGAILVNYQCADSDDPTESTCYVVGANTNGDTLHASEDSTCSPFYLRFGPFYCTDGDLGCSCGNPFEPSGEYYIEITE